ncbi:unnamed protein product [Fraxinus pennsylvanica]|uniref:Uncharacterized protein n=1 Tax=Fraxinus pennsylvanica TaxID=56036 RepID=A0AAD2EF69_9LAMI|nr:unnamed protein product [Fraxinus pennsylvanica]
MRIINWCLKKFRYYVVFSKEAMFIFGLIFVHSFVENALVNILITHLSGVWDVPKSAKVVNLQEGTSAVLQILFAIASDAYQGRFKMVVFSTISYIIGLVLFWNAARNRNAKIPTFYLGLVLITLAKATKEVSLKAFLDDQFMANNIPATEKDKERQHSRSNVWWRSTSILDALAAVFVSISLDLFSMISAIAMVVAYLWFWLGAKFYECNRPTGSAISDVLFVIKTAVLKRNILYATIIKGRIGIGMTFSVICCIFAWKNAVHWLYLVNTYTQPSIHTDIFSLTPQFIFLGIMKGLSEGGLQSFFRSQVSESLKNYGPPFGECVIGIGKFLSVIFILIFSSWFGQDIDSSRLDNYYAMLTLLSFVNFLIYWLVAYWHGYDQFSPEVYCEPLIEGAQDSIGPLVLPSFSDQTSNNLRYVSVSTRRTQSLSDKMPNNPSYFSVFRRRTLSFPGPACPRTPNRLDDAYVQEKEELLHIKIFDYEHRDVL